MRVKEDHYNNLERITEKFPDRELILVGEAADFLGCDKRTLFARKDFPLKRIGRRYYFASVALARWLS